MPIISEKDQVVLNDYAAESARWVPDLIKLGFPASPESVPHYRKFMLALNRFLFPPGFKSAAVASFEAKRALRPGLTASVAVPRGRGPFPIMVHAHGHGLRAGSSPEYEPWIRLMASYGFVIVFPDYEWQPEVTYEAQVEQMLYSINWAKNNARALNGNGEQMILGGDSAGGMLAFDVLLRTLADPNGPRFRVFAGVDPQMNGPQAEQLMKSLTPQTSLPPIYLEAGSADFNAAGPTMQFADRLRQLQKNFQFDMSYGMPHDFIKMPQMDAAVESNKRMMDFLKRALS